MAYEAVDIRLTKTVSPAPYPGYTAAQDELIGGNPFTSPAIAPDGGGVQALFDLSFPLSNMSLGSNPTNGQVIGDMSVHANASVVITGSGGPTAAGGGYDYGGATDRPTLIRFPSSSISGLFAHQRYLICAYMQLPSSGNWPSASVLPIFAMGSNTAYAMICYMRKVPSTSGVPSLEVFRQNGAGQDLIPLAIDGSAGGPVGGFYGQVVQIGAWRADSGQVLQVVSATGGAATTPIAVGTDNSTSWVGQNLEFGCSALNWTSPFSGESLTARNFRQYRGFVEDLHISGRDPVTVLAQDFVRTFGRNAFS